MSEMQLIYGDGEAKVCKTSVMAIAEKTRRDEFGMDVQRAEAGTFFQRVTVATLEELDRLGIAEPTDSDFRSASANVIAANSIYNENRAWHLHRQSKLQVPSIRGTDQCLAESLSETTLPVRTQARDVSGSGRPGLPAHLFAKGERYVMSSIG